MQTIQSRILKMKEINIQKAFPRIGSVQYLICEIFGKTFYTHIYKAFKFHLTYKLFIQAKEKL